MLASESDFKELPINPDRFCEGISKIGYRPAPAVMDIVDNSVSAGATHIEIELVTRAGTTNSTPGNIEVFRIYDNGCGMAAEAIEKALEIGSDVVYPENSLSKFGFGLKSAGFSLGRRIEVTSKPRKGAVVSGFVDRDVIRERCQYGVCIQAPPIDFSTWLNEHESGTIIEVSKTKERQDSAAKIRRELKKKLGATYYYFLSRIEKPLKIIIRLGNEIENIEPLDILFWRDAKE